MWLVLLGFLLFFILVTALWFSKQVSHREDIAYKAKTKARTLKQQIAEIEEVCDTLNIYDSNESLLNTIYSHIISLTRNVNSIETSIENSSLLEHYIFKQSKIKDNLPKNTSIPDNDQQINIVKRHIGKTITNVKQLTMLGSISELEASEHIARLRQLKVQIEVNAFMMQGGKCEHKQDKITAASYYKHAKELLLNTEVSFDDQSEQIKNISIKISKIFNAQDKEIKKEKKKKEEPIDAYPLTTFKQVDEDEEGENA
ncbi:MAG: hypothetical protein MJK11_17770 [Pseudomonadales bacterium]|nr:hypothetical protein [Pseudomonadales bacterium]